MESKRSQIGDRKQKSINLTLVAFLILLLCVTHSLAGEPRGLSLVTGSHERSGEVEGQALSGSSRECKPGKLLVIVRKPPPGELVLEYFKSQAKSLINEYQVVSIERLSSVRQYESQKATAPLDSAVLRRAERYFQRTRFDRLLIVQASVDLDTDELVRVFGSHPAIEYAQGDCGPRKLAL